jgi:hypothetical protein
MSLTNRKYYEHYESPADGTEAAIVRVYCCPCCGYPTVGEPPSYEICPICCWEDDGRDGGGPNACSLVQAQEYFQQYLTSYSPTHEFSPQFQSPDRRLVHQKELSPRRIDFKRRLMAALNYYIAETDFRRRGELWQQLPKE